VSERRCELANSRTISVEILLRKIETYANIIGDGECGCAQ
jgi:hypothetical protein